MDNCVSLNGEWRLRLAGRVPTGVDFTREYLKANVPGTVHTDLLNAGLIPNPFYRDNELKVQWIEEADWEYSREFQIDKEQLSCPAIFLAFDGIDTIAEVYVNRTLVLKTRDMFALHRVRIEKHVRAGQNAIRVVIHSPTRFAKSQEKRHGQIFAELDTYRVHIRKAQYSFGWDWGPRLATSGIWKDVRIEFVRDAMIEEALLITKSVGSNSAGAHLSCRLFTAPKSRLADKFVRLNVSDGVFNKTFKFAAAKSVEKELALKNIDLWWTHDLGEPKLYDVSVDLVGAGEKILSSKRLRTGFRDVKLVRKKDKHGESFGFELNHEKIFARGADWIPSDSFMTRVHTSDYKQLVAAAKQAEMNMLRVWGGGVYEHDDFYGACDESGILVWQDLMFACASYPEYREFVEEVENEVRLNVRRISVHPCIALFCGNNESEWIWRRRTGKSVDEMPGAELFVKTFGRIVGTHSPGTNYWRSSPFGGDDPDSQSEGNHHQWEVWSDFKPPSEYLTNRARFVSEFGFQAPPSLATIKEFTEPEDRSMQSRIIRHHNKQVQGTERLFRFASGEVKLAEEFEDLVLQMQLVQAKAIKTGVDNWRSRKWTSAGALFWQLNDCWPVSSWSAIDYRKRPKALYYWAKKFFKPLRLIMVQRDDSMTTYLVNDTLERYDLAVNMMAADVYGNVIGRMTRELRCGRNSIMKIGTTETSVLGKDSTVISATAIDLGNGTEADSDEALLVPWLDFNFESPQIDIEFSKSGEGELIKLKSDVFVQGVYLPVDELVGELSDNFFSLYPNKEKLVLWKGDRSLAGLKLRVPLLARSERSS